MGVFISPSVYASSNIHLKQDPS
ncbi:uncharacterized protein METZ01_LOCUS433208, partial [marine metagenome]